ncbi:MAG: polyprenyl diphosphate synthase [Minisyncoccia bacterium]
MSAPRCLAIIPDGNRRWALYRSLWKRLGHEQGLKNCRRVIPRAFDLGTKHIVLWAGSESNLKKRPLEEVCYLFSLLKQELEYRIDKPDEARFYIRGIWRQFTDDPEIKDLAGEAEHRTMHVLSRSLTLLFGYGGLTELAHAATAAARDGIIDITPEVLRQRCWNSHLPNIDLLIRTGIEQNDYHCSDSFLPLHTEHMQLYYSDKYWPDFTADDLSNAFAHYRMRARRCGA